VSPASHARRARHAVGLIPTPADASGRPRHRSGHRPRRWTVRAQYPHLQAHVLCAELTDARVSGATTETILETHQRTLGPRRAATVLRDYKPIPLPSMRACALPQGIGVGVQRAAVANPVLAPATAVPARDLGPAARSSGGAGMERTSTFLAGDVVYFHRKWTKIRPKLSESFSTRW
jgi:hypothetical protein